MTLNYVMASTLFHHSFWARSAGGLELELYAKKHMDVVQNPLLFIGGVHGDEPEGVRLAEEFLAWLRQTNPNSVHDWVLIPCLNKDGYLAKSRTNSNGVDLNRNFPSRDWKSSEKKDRYYSGTSAASEPEVQSLVQLVHKIKPSLIVHFHSWEPCIVYTGEPGKKFAELLNAGNNYEVRADIGYPTPGSLGNWGWFENSIPVICIEEQEKIELNQVWPHFSQGLQKLVMK